MLSENIYVNKNSLDIKRVTSSRWGFYWCCPNCDSHYAITKDNIEDFITSDAHDPLEDYMMCPVCNKAYGLFKGVEGKTKGVSSRIWADGTYVYLSVFGKDERIL